MVADIYQIVSNDSFRLREMADEMRKLAERIESGEVSEAAVCYGVKNGEETKYGFVRTGSNQSTLVMAAVLYDWALGRFKS